MKRLVALLAFLTAFPALSTDMYLPALPMLVEQWGQPLVVVNLTLVAFFICYCLFIMVYGPLSDRYGRRPPLIVGNVVYMVACLGCALSQSVYVLIAFRALQGAGAAASQTLAMAICKDRFEGLERGRILANMVGIMALAPMVGPIFGGWMLKWFPWPWLFVAQSVLGLIALLGVWYMEESLKDPVRVSAFQVVMKYVEVVKNGPFMQLNLAMAFLGIPFFGFIAASSDLYITRFGLSEQEFGYFFAFTSAGMMVGPMAMNRLSRKYSYKLLIGGALTGVAAGGSYLLLGPLSGPWSLALPIWVVVFCFGVFRPACNNLALEQVSTDVGTASSLLVFSYFTMGAIGMWLLSLEWDDRIRILGWANVLTAGCALAFWLLRGKRYVLEE